MSFSAIWHRRLKYMLTPQFDLYKRIGERFCTPKGLGLMGPTVLDYGCGTGFGTIQLRYGEVPDVWGVDCDGDAIEFAQSVIGNFAQFRCADVLMGGTKGALGTEWTNVAIATNAEGFHVVTLIEVIEHMEKNRQEELIETLSAYVNDEGVLILSTPNKRSQFRKHAGHVGMHDPGSLFVLLFKHFADVSFEDYLGEALPDDTSVSPLVAVCRRPRRP